MVSSNFTLNKSEIPTMTIEDVLLRLGETAQDMARQTAQYMYGTIAAAVDKVGNTVSAGGKKPTAETLLEALTKIQIDFNPDGSPRMPEWHVHPDAANAIELAGEELERDPELKREFGQLLARKKEEWRAREANRKLVG